jgi:AraC-like DNA-binding protein
MNMITPPSTYKVFFGELSNLFTKQQEGVMRLELCVGEGFVQIFNLDEGLQAKFWDCSFKHQIEMYGEPCTTFDDTFYTLVFFLNSAKFEFSDNSMPAAQDTIWDTILISSKSRYKLYISPDVKGQCLSITFLKKWLKENVLESATDVKNLKENIKQTEYFPLLECMTLSEKKLVQELFDSSWKKSLGSFYIKSCILKIISNFFAKIKDQKISSSNKIEEAEEFLLSNLTGPLPNLKDLADKFSSSESTLKRHFKKKYGVNVSTYFQQKKMEYAKHLIHERNVSVNDTALLLGYKNEKDFAILFDEYNNDRKEAGISIE